MSAFTQPSLFELPTPHMFGWYPSDLEIDTRIHWTSAGEVEGRLDATYYVVTRRQDRLRLHFLAGARGNHAPKTGRLIFIRR